MDPNEEILELATDIWNKLDPQVVVEKKDNEDNEQILELV